MAGTSNPMLLALKGHITIVFMDQEVMEGEYITQDIYNIFITVDNQPMMVPRSQIRYIKGTTVGQIEVDTSQDDVAEGTDVSAQMPATPLVDVDDDDSTDKIAAFEQAPIPVEDDDDDTATFELPESPIPAFDDEDDGTVVLPPDSHQFEEDDDDDDMTFVLPPTDENEDEDDATFVLPPDSLDEEDDLTVRLTEGQPAPTATLVCTSGPHSGQVFKLDSDSISIGRSSDNKVALSGDKEISRRHSIITLEAGNYVIKDRGSLNGTFVNNEAVTETHTLQNGDEILVGISTLKYEEM